MAHSAKRLSAALFLLYVVTACSSREEPGGPATDAGTDAATGGGDSGSTTMRDGGTDAGDVDAGPLTGESRFYVVSFMDLAAETGDMVAEGFDIDGRVSDRTDEQSCRKEDYTSPPPESVMGVDNQLAPLLADAETTFHIRENLSASVQSGEILVLLEVRGIDDLDDDDRVEVDALVGLLPDGVTMPASDASGHLTGGQTFDVDAMSVAGDMALITLRGQIAGGRLTAGPGDFTMSLPIQGSRVEFEAKQARIAFDITESELSNGVVGGSLNVDDTVMAMEDVEGFDAATARVLLESNADLDRDDASGECQAISIALVFDGVDAVRGTTRTP